MWMQGGFIECRRCTARRHAVINYVQYFVWPPPQKLLVIITHLYLTKYMQMLPTGTKRHRGHPVAMYGDPESPGKEP